MGIAGIKNSTLSGNVIITVRGAIIAAKGASVILYRSLELLDINFTPPQTGRVVFTHH
jgi:hypothetical protein